MEDGNDVCKHIRYDMCRPPRRERVRSRHVIGCMQIVSVVLLCIVPQPLHDEPCSTCTFLTSLRHFSCVMSDHHGRACIFVKKVKLGQ